MHQSKIVLLLSIKLFYDGLTLESAETVTSTAIVS